MKIQMKTLSSGPAGSFQPGQIVDLPEDQARAFVAGGYAVTMESKPKVEAPKPADAPIETAAGKPAPETAAMGSRKRKPKAE
jgi:hypothetical protein